MSQKCFKSVDSDVSHGKRTNLPSKTRKKRHMRTSHLAKINRLTTANTPHLHSRTNSNWTWSKTAISNQLPELQKQSLDSY